MSNQVFINCGQGGPLMVYVREGKIVRIRPLILDDADAPSWKIEARGRTFSPPRKVCLAAYSLTEHARVYSEDRIKYPMIRTDFDPKGERNPQNRGKSGYRRISWNEALDIVAGEMRRVREKYGPSAIMSRPSSHHNWGFIGYRTSVWARFFNLIGFTEILDNPDSWEGWHWGSTHAYGFFWRFGLPEQYDLLEDALKNTDLIIHWGNDPESTHGVYGGQESALWRIWLKQLKVKQIHIDPFCNYSAIIQADKWIAPRPGTDAAMAEAIAYVWLKDGTYDSAYIESHTLGFEEFKKHILGEEDGVARTPQWAEDICGVSARIIISLAREWASKRTMLAAGTRGGESGICRQAYGTECPRLMVYLQAMQGLGKPGINIWGTTMGAPFNPSPDFPGYNQLGINTLAKKPAVNPVSQKINRLLVPEAILNPPVHWNGPGCCGGSLEQQFEKYTYPAPGYSEIKMFYRYGGSFLSTLINTTQWARMYQSPKLECVVNQDVWWCNETRFADVILPACTNLERNDISEWAHPSGASLHSSCECNHRIMVYEQKCIEPLYESHSDYWIMTQLADRLGVKGEYTEGNSEEDWIEKYFYATGLPECISFEEFKRKGYYVVPLPENYRSTPALRWFYEGRDCDTPDYRNPKRGTDKGKELGTYSGKIEFVSESLKKFTPDDRERPLLARYIPSWEGYDSDLAERYPLQLISPHPRMTFHTHHDTHVPWLGEIPANRIYKNGYYWHTVHIHPADAGSRGIRDRDIIKLYNDRAAVLGIAIVSERVRPGVVHSYEGSSLYDPVEPGNPSSPDRGGCVNMLSSGRTISQNVPGMAPNSTLIEVSRWEE
ncbi:MAG: molybdopterin-dependent oxidoreductase [Dehalococcoidales bacterium]|nr:molybdopterin-dependent oxidoreductase [Dehalococcoidales bacterium]